MLWLSLITCCQPLKSIGSGARISANLYWGGLSRCKCANLDGGIGLLNKDVFRIDDNIDLVFLSVGLGLLTSGKSQSSIESLGKRGGQASYLLCRNRLGCGESIDGEELLKLLYIL